MIQKIFENHSKQKANVGEIIDIENVTIEKEVDKISKRRRVSITGHRFDIFGICRKCKISNQS